MRELDVPHIVGKGAEQEDVDFFTNVFTSTNKEETASLMREYIASSFADKEETADGIRTDACEPLFIGIAENVIGRINRT